MPLYEYRVYDLETGKRVGTREEIFKHDKAPMELRDEPGLIAVRSNYQKIAFTPNRWGDTRGTYNRELGGWVSSAADFDRLCKERGLVASCQVGEDAIMRAVEADYSARERGAKELLKFEEIEAKYGGFYREDGSLDEQKAGRIWQEAVPTPDGMEL